MIAVWTDGRGAGALDRYGASGSAFAYDPHAAPERAVSLTLPVRVASWNWPLGLLPIFEMNLPEGALKARLLRRFAKASGRFDDLDLLRVIGRAQLGRIRYAAPGEPLDAEVPFQAVDEILRARRDGGLLAHLLESFDRFSGISGVQPKVLVRDEGRLSDAKLRASPSLKAATHIVKLWDPNEYPELAANEFFCLSAAEAAGLATPPRALSDDGGALVVERFDRREDGWAGLEDFCVLNGLPAASKYDGSYETRLFKRLRDYVEPADARVASIAFYRLMVFNCAIRNGDAHLKNFALLYDRIGAPARWAPAYDLVTTTAYLPQDGLALTLEGSTRWPDAARLERLGRTRAELGGREIRAIFEATADALAQVRPEMRRWFDASPHPAVGRAIEAAWAAGVAALRRT